jgi:hypothetical protein
MKLETLARLHQIACDRLEGDSGLLALFNIGRAMSTVVLESCSETKYCEVRTYLKRARWHFKQARFKGHLRKRDGRNHY